MAAGGAHVALALALVFGVVGLRAQSISTSVGIVTTGVVSVVNSTAAALGGGASFTGQWESVGQFNSVVVASLSDVDGTLYLEFSPDGTNTDSVPKEPRQERWIFSESLPSSR